MKYHPIVAWLVWVALILGLGIIVCLRLESLSSGQGQALDGFVVLLFVALVLAPMFPHIELFGLKFRTELKEQFGEVKNQITTLSANMQSVVNLNFLQTTASQTAATTTEDQSSQAIGRSAIQHKILNTLWTKQVNRYDEWMRGVHWLFRINHPSSEFLGWRDASTSLIRDGLVLENSQGLVFLTPEGFEYCRQRHEEFGTDQWWPLEPIRPEMLERVIGEEGAE